MNRLTRIVMPNDETALGKGLRDAHTVYTLYVNARTVLFGHVQQGCFHSCSQEEAGQKTQKIKAAQGAR